MRREDALRRALGADVVRQGLDALRVESGINLVEQAEGRTVGLVQREIESNSSERLLPSRELIESGPLGAWRLDEYAHALGEEDRRLRGVLESAVTVPAQ